MKDFAAVLLACGAACACAPVVPEAQPQDAREVEFACANDASLSVRFFPQEGKAVLVRNGSVIELQQQRSGSGFLYGNGPTVIRGKGRDLTVEIGRMAPIQCKAR